MSQPSSSCRQGGTQLVVLIVVLILAVGLAVWFWMRPTSQPSPEAGRVVAAEFLKQIRDGQPGEAWKTTTADFKSDQGQESFVKSMKSDPLMKKPLEFVSVQTVTLQDQPRSEYLFRDSEGGTVRVLIRREFGSWKVDRMTKSL